MESNKNLFCDIIKNGMNKDRNLFVNKVSEEIPVAEYKAGLSNKRVNKFINKRVSYNGVWYDSIKECDFAKELDLRKKAFDINDWSRQIPFILEINGIHICKYICDFKVFSNDNVATYYDVKGFKKGGAYRMFKIKQSLMKAIYNIDIVER